MTVSAPVFNDFGLRGDGLSDPEDLCIIAHEFDDVVRFGPLIPRSIAWPTRDKANLEHGKGTHWTLEQDRCPKCIDTFYLKDGVLVCRNRICDYTRPISEDKAARKRFPRTGKNLMVSLSIANGPSSDTGA